MLCLIRTYMHTCPQVLHTLRCRGIYHTPSVITYCIAGKFGEENIWGIYYFDAFGRKKFGK